MSKRKKQKSTEDSTPPAQPASEPTPTPLLTPAEYRALVPADVDLSYILPDIRHLAVPVDVLSFDPSNANEHDGDSIAVISGSMGMYEQHRLLVVNLRPGRPVVIIGNGALEALRGLGWKYVAVLFVDEDHVKATGRAIADNRSAHYSTFNNEVLARQLQALAAEGVPTERFGCTPEYLEDLLAQLGPKDLKVPDGAPQEDPVNAVPKVVIEIHLPPQLAPGIIPQLQELVAPFEAQGAEFNVA